MKPDVREIDIRKIRPNHRLMFDEVTILTLCRDIESNGLRQPINVYLEEHWFKIVDGEKRWRACKKIGMKKIKAIIVD